MIRRSVLRLVLLLLAILTAALIVSAATKAYHESTQLVKECSKMRHHRRCANHAKKTFVHYQHSATAWTAVGIIEIVVACLGMIALSCPRRSKAASAYVIGGRVFVPLAGVAAGPAFKKSKTEHTVPFLCACWALYSTCLVALSASFLRASVKHVGHVTQTRRIKRHHKRMQTSMTAFLVVAVIFLACAIAAFFYTTKFYRYILAHPLAQPVLARCRAMRDFVMHDDHDDEATGTLLAHDDPVPAFISGGKIYRHDDQLEVATLPDSAVPPPDQQPGADESPPS